MAPVAVISRLERLRGHFDRELEELFQSFDLSTPNFAVLVTLARIGGERGVSQRQLADALGLTPGSVSVRVDTLVAQGLVQRSADPASKRSVLVRLTAAGRERFERVVPSHLANERRLLAALSTAERDQLAALLRKLLVEFEGSSACGEPSTRIGIALEPAHITIRRRRDVGLSPVPGLLVRSVDQHSRAQAAGLEAGDVLTGADRRQLRSSVDLRAALEAGCGHQLRLDILRGDDRHELTLDLRELAPDALAVQPATTPSGRAHHTI
jgi:DNA-binding MarR family transcriptional regulator